MQTHRRFFKSSPHYALAWKMKNVIAAENLTLIKTKTAKQVQYYTGIHNLLTLKYFVQLAKEA